MAAASVNGLNEDPDWRPVPPNVSVLSLQPRDREVHLRLAEAASAHHRQDLAGARVDRDQRPLRVGRARQVRVDRGLRRALQPEVERGRHPEPPPKTAAPPYLLIR